MAAGRFVVPPYFPARNRDFDLLSGAKLYVYDNLTTDKANIYTDEALTVLSANPVIANSSGQFPAIWAQAGTEAEPVLYSVSVTTSTGASPGNPFNFDNYRPSVDWETATLALAEAAADAAAASAAEAAADLTSVESIYDDILAIEATGSDAPAIAARALRDGSNLTGSEPTQFRTAIAAVGAAELAASGGSALVGFLQSGTGASAVAVQNKLRQAPVQPNAGEFGAFTNATITTATLLAAFTAAMADGRPVELSGAYTINGPITPTDVVNGAELHIILKDEVTITVTGATTFNRVFYAESATVTSHSITGGGTLTIDCANLAASGIWLRHTAASTGGTVILNAPVHVKNVKAPTGITVSTGILTLGRFERIIMRSPTVEDVDRTDAVGESSGIYCGGFDGEVEIYSPVVRRVYYGPGTGDADCIKCFGRFSGATNSRREGSVRIYSPVLEDGQVRLYKDQCGDTVVFAPWGRRRAVDGVPGSFAASTSVDFDFQFGGGLVLDAHVEYYKSATNVTPLGSSHSVFAFQQLIDNSEMYGAARNTTVISNVAIPRFALVAENGSASVTEIDGATLIPGSGFTTTMITRGLVEFYASQVGAKTTETTISVKRVSGPITATCIGYTSYSALDTGTATAGGATTLTNSAETWTVNEWAGYELLITSGTGIGQARTIASNTATELTVSAAWGTNPDATSVYRISYSMADKLTVKVDDCSTSLPVSGATTRAIDAISGNQIVRFKAFEIGDNPGFRNFYVGWNFDVRNLRAGTKLLVATAANLITNGPPWGTGGDNGYIECRSLGFFSTTSQDTICRAYLNNASASPSSWFTQDGGTNWPAQN